MAIGRSDFIKAAQAYVDDNGVAEALRAIADICDANANRGYDKPEIDVWCLQAKSIRLCASTAGKRQAQLEGENCVKNTHRTERRR